jgi:DNA-binding NtrC family response regulator
LQDRSFSPVGSHDRVRFEGRVIAATNRSIDELREKKLFRDDFYYRLCSDVIVVPPLRQRIAEDPRELDTLFDHVLLRMTGSPSAELRGFVKSAIQKNIPPGYPWPGNVRELEQCVRSILLTGAYSAESAARGDELEAGIVRAIHGQAYDADGLLADYCTLLYRSFGSYEEVARRLKLDRRTVKKYILARPPLMNTWQAECTRNVYSGPRPSRRAN